MLITQRFCTYKHGRSCPDLGPVALKELHDCDVVEVEHAWKVLDLKATKHAATLTNTLLGESKLKCCCTTASHQVLCKVIDELAEVQALVLVQVVLKHGGDLLRSHHRSAHVHRVLASLNVRT